MQISKRKNKKNNDISFSIKFKENEFNKFCELFPEDKTIYEKLIYKSLGSSHEAIVDLSKNNESFFINWLKSKIANEFVDWDGTIETRNLEKEYIDAAVDLNAKSNNSKYFDVVRLPDGSIDINTKPDFWPKSRNEGDNNA